MKRNDISGLERHRGRYFMVGLACALFIAWSAFEWTTSSPPMVLEEESYDHPQEVEVVRTIYQKEKARPLPKPERFSSKVEIVTDLTGLGEAPILDTVIQSNLQEPAIVFSTRNVPLAPPPRPVLPEPEAPLIIAEVMPRFPGCEDLGLDREERKACAEKKLLEYIYSHIEYPRLALENDISGMVVVQFVVEKDGSITGAEVMREIGGGCGREVLRVVDSMPKWIPGSQQGRKVRVMFRLPVRFEPAG